MPEKARFLREQKVITLFEYKSGFQAFGFRGVILAPFSLRERALSSIKCIKGLANTAHDTRLIWTLLLATTFDSHL